MSYVETPYRVHLVNDRLMEFPLSLPKCSSGKMTLPRHGGGIASARKRPAYPVTSFHLALYYTHRRCDSERMYLPVPYGRGAIFNLGIMDGPFKKP